MNIPKDWRVNESEDTLYREYNFKTFLEAVDFVNQVANLAQAADHHPNILISYTKVLLSLSTHSVGTITEKDLDLALKINELPL